jgi:hypothetical protein
MDKLEEMWAALAAYQPQADAAGHGPSWARMCKEKNVEAAYYAAADAAADAYAAAAADAYAAAAAAVNADAADADADAAKKWAQIAIDRITKVLVKPAPVQPIGYVKLIDTPFGEKLKPVLTVAVPVGAKLYTTPPAQPAPAPVPTSWMEMVTANLVREGVNKHKARELAEHFYGLAPTAQPAVPDAITNIGEDPKYRAGWNECRETMMEMMKARTL